MILRPEDAVDYGVETSITDCAYCGLPTELDNALVMNTSEGPRLVYFYRCLGVPAHQWPEVKW